MTLLNIFDLASAPQDPKDVAILLKGRYPISEVETAIQELSDEGFIFKDRGCWKVKERFMKEIDLNTNFFLRRYHNESLKLAYESLHNEETTERYLVGANFSINQKVYPRIISKLNEFLENLIELEGVAGASDAVVHLNMQLMKMTADQPTVPAKKEKTQFTAAKKDSRSNLPEVSR